MACPVAPEPVAPDLWDEAGWAALATRAVSLARASGALSVLPTALAYRAGVHVHMGEFAAAARLVDEASALATTAGTTPLRYTALLVTAWRGDETAASAAIDTAIAEARTYGEGRALGLAHCAIAILCNGRGRYADALAAAQIACQYEDVGFYGTALTELVEAAARVGEPGAAAAAADELVARTRASGTDWALGVGRRTEALFAADGRADELFGESVAALVQTKAAPDLARTRLLYGEWLRREGERARAREQLRAAYEMFDGMGAAAFAERARRELSATGETVRTRARGAPAPLTPQEAQIARLAGDGLTNPEIGAELFLSPHTVEWHLRKVFTKLGISSRRQLRSRSMRERLDVS
jgi:ATP/maltotriose-dependent transcriptional regulator MalT